VSQLLAQPAKTHGLGFPAFDLTRVGLSWANECVDGICLGLYRDSSQQLIKNAKWKTRAWAYQEMMLSKRIQVFTEEEVLYECDSELAWRESVVAEHPELPSADFSIPSLQPLFKLRLDTFNRDIESCDRDKTDSDKGDNDKTDSVVALYERYLGILLPYLRREMTYPSDALKAFQRVLSEIERSTGHGFFKGLPGGLLLRKPRVRRLALPP